MKLAVGAVTVPCPECNVVLPEHDLRLILPVEFLDRMHARSLEQAIASVEDLCACPTPNCPMRVALEEGATPRMKCPECKKVSCLRCGAQPYHHRLTCEQYAAKKKKMKKKAQADDGEEDFRKWMAEVGAKQCPTCKVVVTKQNIQHQGTQKAECHKMMCRQCGTRFCFKCEAKLSDTFTCGCTRNDHGFINPKTGKREEHLRKPKKHR
jgi:hypothetical protein